MKMESSDTKMEKSNYLINGHSITIAYQEFWKESGITMESPTLQITDSLGFKYRKRKRRKDRQSKMKKKKRKENQN